MTGLLSSIVGSKVCRIPGDCCASDTVGSATNLDPDIPSGVESNDSDAVVFGFDSETVTYHKISI